MANTPRYALVVYADDTMDHVLLCDLAEEKARGAIVIGVEDWDCLPWPRQVEPAQSNPRRTED